MTRATTFRESCIPRVSGDLEGSRLCGNGKNAYGYIFLKYAFPCLCAVLLVISVHVPANAQESAARGNDKLVVTADKTLEWHRDKKRFYARGTAVAEREGSRIHGDTLIAHYRDSEDDNFEIHKLVAEDNVRIVSDDSTAHGARAVYDVDKRRAVMTGDDLRLVMPDQTVFADKRFVYDVAAGQFTALGNARIDRDDTTLQSDKLVAGLVTNDKGERVIDTATATGNVRITTPQERVTGDRAVYTRARDEVEITGGVDIKRGQNTLQGGRAVVDLKSEVSRLYSGEEGKGDGRVRGVFYPEQDGDAQ